MKNNFPKRYDQEIEIEIFKKWESNNLFSSQYVKDNYGKKYDWKFVISIPPPNVTWVLHLWHAFMLTIQDIMVRYNRMLWKETVWIPWTDHAWIATQVVVEKKIKESLKKSRHELWRKKFLDEVREWVKYSRNTINSQVKRMWASCDWSKEQFTLSEQLSRSVRKAFKDLYYKRKIYNDTYIVNWCTHDQTVISDLEVEYKTEISKLYYIRYFIEWKGDFLTVATVRPETIFWDVAVAVNPKDKRFKKYIWKNVLIPIINKPIPIIADERVDKVFWTWVLKITPAHDPDDFNIWLEHWLPLDNYVIDKNWNLTELAWIFCWKKISDAIENIIQFLVDIWNLEKVEEYENNVPYCERCGTLIEPMVSKQWFMDINKTAKDTTRMIDSKYIEIIPDRFKKNLFSFLDDIKPWCISRQLWWGHRVPVWICEDWHHSVFDEDVIFDTYKPDNWKKIILTLIIFNLIADWKLWSRFNIESLFEVLNWYSLISQKWKIIDVYLSIYKNKFINNNKLLQEITEIEEIFSLDSVANNTNIENKWDSLLDFLEESDLIIDKWDLYTLDLKCSTCWKSNLRQDEDVLDTWFSSWLWPFSILGWPEETVDYKKYYPNNVLETWYDILFFWVARMIFMWIENTNSKPFENVYLHGLIRDEKWQKMSKSKWNVVDTLDIIDKYWADALRLWIIIWSTPWNDIRFSEQKIEYYYRFLNKLWNATRFVYMSTVWECEWLKFDYDSIYNDITSNTDKFNNFDVRIIDRINSLVNKYEKYASKSMFWEIAHECVNCAWHDLCDRYLEITKIEKSEYSDKILLYSIWTLLKLLHPYIPHVTEKLWSLIWFEWFLMISSFPKVVNNIYLDSKVSIYMYLITEIRNQRSKLEIKPHEKINLIIACNSSMQKFILDNKSILLVLCKVLELELVWEDYNIPDKYDSTIIFDIKVWIRVDHVIDNNEKLESLEKQLNQNNQMLQNIRMLLSNSWFTWNAPNALIENKKKRMEELKSTILALEYEISKIRSNMK